MGLGDKTLLDHPADHVVAAPESCGHIRIGGIDRGAAENPGDERRFLQGEVGDALAEIEIRRRLHSVDSMVEVELVAVQLQDLFFGVLFFDLQGEVHLFELPADGLLGIEEQEAGQLLGDGASALGLAKQTARPDVLFERPQDSQEVHAAMVIKTGVLGGDDGLFQNIRNLVRGDFNPSFDGEIPDGLALVRIDRGDEVGFERLELGNRGKVPFNRPVGAEAGPEHSGGAESQD